MNRRTVRLTVRLTPEENQRLTQAAQERGYQAVAQFARASLARSVTQAQVIEEVHSLEKRQAATLSAVRTEIARFQRTEYVVFAMLENLSGVNYFFGWTTTISPGSATTITPHRRALTHHFCYPARPVAS
jgi:uncharacterized protein (DUF1778 family)